MLNMIRYKRNLINNGSAKPFFACQYTTRFGLSPSSIYTLLIIDLSACPTLTKAKSKLA